MVDVGMGGNGIMLAVASLAGRVSRERSCREPWFSMDGARSDSGSLADDRERLSVEASGTTEFDAGFSRTLRAGANPDWSLAIPQPLASSLSSDELVLVPSLNVRAESMGCIAWFG
jgi:hypothetical protein